MRKTRSFGHQMVLLGLLPVIVLASAFLAFYLNDRFSSLESGLQERGKLIVRQVAVASEYGIFANSHPALEEVAKSSLSQRDVDAVAVFDTKGGVLVEDRALSGGFGALDEALRNLKQAVASGACAEGGTALDPDDSPYLLICQPVYATRVALDEEEVSPAAMVIGYAGITLKREAVLKSKSKLVLLAGLLAMFVLLATYAIHRLTRQRVTVPIVGLSEAVRRIGQGDLSTAVQTDTDISELRTLCRGIDQMRSELLEERSKLEEKINDATRKLQELAYYDTVTMLPNRRLFMDRLTYALAASRRSQAFGAVIFVDLDNFKPINDQYGHEAGDKLLIEVGQRLAGAVREIDVVGRFGGDEFAVLLPDLSEIEAEAVSAAGVVAEKIRLALERPRSGSRTARPRQCCTTVPAASASHCSGAGTRGRTRSSCRPTRRCTKPRTGGATRSSS